MIRFAWLQARTQVLTATAGLLIVVIIAALTGPYLAHLYSVDVLPCAAHGSCDAQFNAFLDHDHFFQQTLDILMRITPALFGLFWGAPLLARELETGTFRVAWTQSVTRSRWLVNKLALGLLTAVVIAGLLALTTTWWYRAFDLVQTNNYAVFDRRGIAMIGYTAFAFAIGALLGVVIRRTLPAMAATLGAFVFSRVAIALWVRPHLFSPLRKAFSLEQTGGVDFIAQNGGPVALSARSPDIPNAWVQSSHLVSTSGHVATFADRVAFVKQYCGTLAQLPSPSPGGINRPVRGPAPEGILTCRQKAAETYHVLVTYQPAGRWWTFQGVELGIFVGLAMLALAGCYWWVTRRSG